MNTPAHNPNILKIADIVQSAQTEFDLRFAADDTREAARILGIPGVSKMRFQGTFAPVGKQDWELKARIGATVTQDCVVTLQPVRTRIDDDVYRLYLKDLPDYEEGSVNEMEIEDFQERLTPEIDLFAIALEAVALALPPYPRTEGAALENAQFAPDNVVPMTDEDAKPFASLAALKDKLEKE